MRPASVYRKYGYYLLKFGTVRKVINLLHNRLEHRLNRTLLSSHPYKVTIDTGSFCNLQCPGCHTGIKHQEMLTPAFLKPEAFKFLFNQVKDHVFSIALYNWGEPFLNKNIFEMIAHATASRVGTTIHTNFNHFNEKMARKTVESGLTHIYLSIDGATQDTYVKYRQGGNLDTVLDNLKTMLQVRREMKSKFPLITWKYLIFEHNRHEVEAARKMSIEMGCDDFETFVGSPHLCDIYDEAGDYKNASRDMRDFPDTCSSLWSSIYIHSDGTVFPCSLAFRQKESFGNLFEKPYSEIRNNKPYTSARSMFSEKSNKTEIPWPCRGCKYAMKCKAMITD
ncbi:MAG: radical SAM protein [Bacteroidetes bacterium]|nr:radical SAM protein [Bacteroidota bacterium]